VTWRSVLRPRLKRTALIWLAVYPTVLIVLSLLGAHFRHWPLPLRVLGSTLIIVPIVVNISAPLIEALLSALRRYWTRDRRGQIDHD
jgi:antibiotic biosynthesis monooxygenase (ABM) superfamily enzyme